MKAHVQAVMDTIVGAGVAQEDMKTARKRLGKALHTIQDSYSHTDRVPETAKGLIVEVYAYLPEIRGAVRHKASKDDPFVWKTVARDPHRPQNTYTFRTRDLTPVAIAAQDATREFGKVFLSEMVRALRTRLADDPRRAEFRWLRMLSASNEFKDWPTSLQPDLSKDFETFFEEYFKLVP